MQPLSRTGSGYHILCTTSCAGTGYCCQILCTRLDVYSTSESEQNLSEHFQCPRGRRWAPKSKKDCRTLRTTIEKCKMKRVQFSQPSSSIVPSQRPDAGPKKKDCRSKKISTRLCTRLLGLCGVKVRNLVLSARLELATFGL